MGCGRINRRAPAAGDAPPNRAALSAPGRTVVAVRHKRGTLTAAVLMSATALLGTGIPATAADLPWGSETIKLGDFQEGAAIDFLANCSTYAWSSNWPISIEGGTGGGLRTYSTP